LLEKKLPFEERIEDLANKSKEFLDLYKSISPDPTARAKVPILEVGTPGTSEYFAMIESGAVSEYIAAEYANEGVPLKPSSGRDEARMRLFMQVYAEGMQAAETGLMVARSEEDVVQAFEKLCIGMISADACLEKHGKEDSGSFFLGAAFSLAEAFTAPFAARCLVKMDVHRGINVIDTATDLGLSRLVRWLRAVMTHESVSKTTPSAAYLSKVPPYLAPTWFAFKMPAARQKDIAKSVLTMDATAEEEARKALMKEGAAAAGKL